LRFITALRQITKEKIDDFIAYNIINFDQILEDRNEELRNKGQSEFRMEKMKDISLIISSKPEERSKYEISKNYPSTANFRIGMWFTPLQKCGYRLKPIDFESVKCQIEIPRTVMS